MTRFARLMDAAEAMVWHNRAWSHVHTLITCTLRDTVQAFFKNFFVFRDLSYWKLDCRARYGGPALLPKSDARR